MNVCGMPPKMQVSIYYIGFIRKSLVFFKKRELYTKLFNLFVNSGLTSRININAGCHLHSKFVDKPIGNPIIWDIFIIWSSFKK